MKTDDFDYDLPEDLIAQTPLEDRSASRLLVLDRSAGRFEDRHFKDILDYLEPGDALVLNETKVLPARLIGEKETTGGTVELLLLKNLTGDVWECLARPQKRLRPGTKILFGRDAKPENSAEEAPPENSAPDKTSSESAPLVATVLETKPEGITHVEFSYAGLFLEVLDRLGTMPLPPYIHKRLEDQGRYQTVYAKNLGSAAAPTAGLHFTPELLQAAKDRGIRIIKITLHVGLGTFRPVQVDDVKNHQMHTEAYEISADAAEALNAVKAEGHKIFAVGTTTVRTLETCLKNHERFESCSGETSIFIYPGFEFRAVDGLITNFHLPKSTLLMLVSAFATRDQILKAYHHAVEEKYRFFSFGDAMLITGEKHES